MKHLLAVATVLALTACASPPAPEYDVIIRGGTIYDGSGGTPFVGDVGVNEDTIAAVGDLAGATAATEIDASGLAVSPGFINMLSWSTDSLILDGRSQGEIRQGVTLEVFGEGVSYGPWNDRAKREWLEERVAFADSEDVVRAALELPEGAELEVPWTTLGEYMQFLEGKGVATNIASFVGATSVRIHEVGYEDRPPSAEELARMRTLVQEAMLEGALGVGSSLIYAPAFYADTAELIALCEVAAEYGGIYISHIRSEGSALLEAIDELITISREAGLPAEIYHFKASGRPNWDKLDAAIAAVEAARAEGLRITADMYTYPASSTGLDASMPPWVQEGGYEAWAERLRDPEIRARVAVEMATPTDEWENAYVDIGPENILLVGFRNRELRSYIGKTLAEVAEERGASPEQVAMDLVVEDGSRVQVVYFGMSEDNVRKKVAIPWMAFDSDAASMAPEGIFLTQSTHPRAYGSFARLLGRYVRDEGIVPLEEAIRRLTSFPAGTLGILDRGMLEVGYFADIVVFDPATIIDHATYDEPHQYATGVVHVFVNGDHVLADGEHTGATPGRFIRGPGWDGTR